MLAQLMSEMLSPATFESFRAFSLGTLARLAEVIDLINDVERDRIPRAALEPAVVELVWSLGKDPIVRKRISSERESLSALVSKKDYSLADLRAHIVLTRRLLSKNYQKELEENILATFDTNEKIELRQTVGFYCSYLINRGYTKEFIAETVEDIFFSKPITRAGRQLLKRFFKVFDWKSRSFSVYILLDDKFAQFARSLNFETFKLPALPDQHQIALSVPANANCGQSVLKRTVSRLDEYGAVNSVHDIVGTLRALCYLDPYGLTTTSGKVIYVEKKGGVGRSLQKQILSFERQTSRGGVARARSVVNITRYSQNILSSFDQPSLDRILTTTSTFALARQSSNAESQLTSLWSAIEVLFGEPPRGEARITHYLRQLVPAVCLRYVRHQTIAVYEELIVSYRRQMKALLAAEQCFPDRDQHTKFASLLYMNENSTLQAKLCSVCSGNPLALHRTWKLHRDFGTSKNVLEALNGHELRVNWQLSRIYRARNTVVHVGEAPPIMDSLVLNAAEYFSTAIRTIINRASRQEGNSDIAQVIAEIGIEYDLLKKFLLARKGAANHTADDLLKIVSASRT